MIRSIATQLMFIGSAEGAMNAYVSAFDGVVREVTYYPTDHPTQAGQVLRAVFEIGSQTFACIDSEDVHSFSFTPSMSVFVELEAEADMRKAYEALSHGGTVLMPLDNYGFSDLFVWFNDRFGVSWQLSFTA